MAWNPVYAELLKKHSDVFALLPNVKPRKAISLIKSAGAGLLVELCDYEQRQAEDFWSEIFIEDTWGVANRVSPRGARCLIDLYKNNAFELKKESIGVLEPVELQKYVEDDVRIAAIVNRRKEEAEGQRQRRKYLVMHPNEVRMDEFSASLLNEIMWKNNVIGTDVEMLIGGVSVSKSVSKYWSNSRKTSDNTVTFRWVDKSGKQREEVLISSTNQFNRANDPDRNWGLPE
jgi:hypothetical protein